MTSSVDAPRVAFQSFRDPAGRLLRVDDRILRVVEPQYQEELKSFLAGRMAREAMAAGKLIRTARTEASRETGAGAVYEHERVSFPSYPYEWPAEMLHAAALLTLDLGFRALDEGFGLKDANPYNVLFRGAKPVFVDVLSFERRDPLDTAWMAYGQFVRTFLLPLLAQRSFGMSLQQTFLAHRDGVEPETAYKWAGLWGCLKPGFAGLVMIPKWLAGNRRDPDATYRPRSAGSQEQARFVFQGLMKRAAKQLETVAPIAHSSSTWTDYLDSKSLYSSAQLAQKERFFQEAVELAKPSTLLDIGANEGHFSLLAARHGASVVAIDTDPAVVGSLWRQASEQKLDVLPLVVDLTRPSPALGWRNGECLSFLERAKDRFDMVSMLAVVHHMLVTERIPLQHILELADQLSRGYLVIEFVGLQDPMFRRILRGREKLYTHISREWFEAAAQSRFELIRSEEIDGLHRWLYLYRRRTAAG